MRDGFRFPKANHTQADTGTHTLSLTHTRTRTLATRKTIPQRGWWLLVPTTTLPPLQRASGSVHLAAGRRACSRRSRSSRAKRQRPAASLQPAPLPIAAADHPTPFSSFLPLGLLPIMLRSVAAVASSSSSRIAARVAAGTGSSRLAPTAVPRSTQVAAAATASRGFATSSAAAQASEAPQQPKMIKLTVDGKEVEVVQG